VGDWSETRSHWPSVFNMIVGVAFALAIIAGLVTPLLFGSTKPHGLRARADIKCFTVGLAAYRRDVGAYPPDDITAIGGSAEYGMSEALVHYLGKRLSKGSDFYGPYVHFKTRQLTDKDADGFQEYRDPWGGPWLYARRTPSSGTPDGETPPRGYDLASPGRDGDLGGRMVPGKGYGPATTPEGKAAEADNVIYHGR